MRDNPAQRVFIYNIYNNVGQLVPVGRTEKPSINIVSTYTNIIKFRSAEFTQDFQTELSGGRGVVGKGYNFRYISYCVMCSIMRAVLNNKRIM